MKRTWEGIEQWLTANAPELLRRLAPGASEKEISSVEKSLNVKLPASYRESLKIHDGETDEAWLLGSHSLLPARVVVKAWSTDRKFAATIPTDDWDWSDVPTGIKSVRWSPGWVPFAYDGSGGHLYIDLDPGKTGQSGQVIQTTFEGDYRLVASSYRSFLQRFECHLKSGSFELVDDCLEPKSDDQWWKPH